MDKASAWSWPGGHVTEPLAGPNSPLIWGTLGFSCSAQQGIRMGMGDSSGDSNQLAVILNLETTR